MCGSSQACLQGVNLRLTHVNGEQYTLLSLDELSRQNGQWHWPALVTTRQGGVHSVDLAQPGWRIAAAPPDRAGTAPASGTDCRPGNGQRAAGGLSNNNAGAAGNISTDRHGGKRTADCLKAGERHGSADADIRVHAPAAKSRKSVARPSDHMFQSPDEEIRFIIRNMSNGAYLEVSVARGFKWSKVPTHNLLHVAHASSAEG